MTRNLRILLVDDHPVVRDGLRWLFESAAGVEVVAEAGDGQTAIRLVGDVAPDVVLMDLAMPGMDGVEATRRIKAASPDTAVLVLTMSGDRISGLTRFLGERLQRRFALGQEPAHNVLYIRGSRCTFGT